MEQLNLFGVKKKEINNNKPKEKTSSFPDVSLLKGLNTKEATSESVFWLRILLNKAIRSQKPEVFKQLLANEIALKKGEKDSYKAIQDGLICSELKNCQKNYS